MRRETRRQRYDGKEKGAITLPASFTTVNFGVDDNLAYLIRTVACFGFSHVNVIGVVPDRNKLNAKSGSLFDYVEIRQYPNPVAFMEAARAEGLLLIAADISPGAISIYDLNFNFDTPTSIILGNETSGIPVEISMSSLGVFIPMPGQGFCLNTSQTGTAFAMEYSRQFFGQNMLKL